MFNIRIPDLPPYARLFVGLFTSLMVLICLWAVLSLYVERGSIDEGRLPAYLGGEVTEEGEDRLSENVGLAHTHINGQTLLFFAMGFVFLFTTAKPRIKRVTLAVFANAIVLHAIGLTGEGYHWIFDDFLPITGVVILALILFMAFLVYVDLGKRPARVSSGKEN